jgi:hypothetical protein
MVLRIYVNLGLKSWCLLIERRFKLSNRKSVLGLYDK